MPTNVHGTPHLKRNAQVPGIHTMAASQAASQPPSTTKPYCLAPTAGGAVARKRIYLSRMEMGVLAGVLEHHTVLEGSAPSATGETDSTEWFLQALTEALADPSTSARAAFCLTAAQATATRMMVEDHYEAHRRTSNGAQVALGRRLERLIRTLRSESRTEPHSPDLPDPCLTCP